MASYSHKNPVLDTYQAIVSTYSEFLTVAIHTILYERNIYPRTSFLSARKYNYPVRQNRHPKVCKWIQDAVLAVEVEMLKGTVSQTSLIIISSTAIPLERFVFSTTSFPIVPTTELLTPFETAIPPLDSISVDQSHTIPPCVPIVDLEEQFRAIFSRLSTCTQSLGLLPPDCSFTVAIELKEKVDPPIGHPQPWIAAEPGLQPEDKRVEDGLTEGSDREKAERRKGGKGKDFGKARTVPVRSVEAGEFILEMWIEEGRGKDEYIEQAGVEDTSQ